MKLFKLLLPLFFLLSGANSLSAQRFDGGIIFGLNFAELTGEDVTDFIGGHLGVRSSMKLKKRLRLGMELVFSEQGEYIMVKSFPNVPITKIKLDYIEVPVQVEWNALTKEEKNAWLNFGLAYAKLINYKIIARDQGDITNEVTWQSESAMLVTIGATAFFNEHIGINFRGAQSLQSLNLSPSLSFRAIYRF